MPDGKRFEDYLTVEELMEKPSQELMAKIYIQTLKTNGTIAQHCLEIQELREDVKLRATTTDVDTLKAEVKDKIGWKFFVIVASVLSVIILIFNILDRVLVK